MEKLRVLILFGGRSAEHEISILSARFVASSLDAHRFEPVLVGIAPSGRWHRLEAIPDGGPDSVAIDATAPEVWLPPAPPARLQTGGADRPIDLAFPVLHGPLGEDGCLQGLFELCELPYVGSGVASSAVAMDKVMQKQLLREAGVPVLPYEAVRRSEHQHDPEGRMAACLALGMPLFVKPANMGSSLGVSRVEAPSDLAAALEEAFRFDTKVLVEPALAGAREIECAVLGNDEPEASLPGEIRVQHRSGFYSYEAKYLDPDGAALDVPADLDEATIATVQRTALASFRALDASGLARVDTFLSSEGALYVNEVNAIPGFTAISMYPALWEASGVPAESLVTRLLDLALERHRARAALQTHR